MHIKRDFQLAFDEDTYVELRGESFRTLLARPLVRERFDTALAEIPALVEPAACYDSFPIAAYLHERVRLANGQRIGGGPVVEVVHGAEALLVAVCTVGAAVDERISAYLAGGERFKAMLLDELASWAVDQVRQQVYRHFQTEAAARGWRVSSMLSPGESTWTVADQPAIFGLLDAAAIGVTLNDACVMSPMKSLSLIAGTGPQPMGAEGLTNCDFCTLKDRCRYRGKRAGAHGNG